MKQEKRIHDKNYTIFLKGKLQPNKKLPDIYVKL